MLPRSHAAGRFAPLDHIDSMGQALLRRPTALHPQLTRWRRDRLGRAGPETPIIAVSMRIRGQRRHTLEITSSGSVRWVRHVLQTTTCALSRNCRNTMPIRVVPSSAAPGRATAVLSSIWVCHGPISGGLAFGPVNRPWAVSHGSMMVLPTQPAIFI